MKVCFIFTKCAKYGFTTMSPNQKDIPWSGNTLTLWGKKDLRQSVKKVMQTVF